MKVPKYIQDSIIKSAKYFSQAREHEKIVRDWLDDKGLDNDTVRDMFIDCIENGSGQADEFNAFLKKI